MDFKEALSGLIPSENATYTEKYYQAQKYIQESRNYRMLTKEEGREIALAALDLYDAGDQTTYNPHIILTNLAAVVPGSLENLYRQLLARDLFWLEGMMFYGADAALRDHLITLVETGTYDPAFHASYRHDEFLYILAWIGDKVVEAAFRRWREAPPAGLPHPEFVLPDAGWEMTPDGQRRTLYPVPNIDLIVVEPAAVTASSSSIQIGGMLNEPCGWCGRDLALLLDIDLTDSRLTFLWPGGERLRIAFCLNCSLQYSYGETSVFMDIDERGVARWSEVNGHLPPDIQLWTLDNPNYISAFAVQPCNLGEPRATSYERDGSHLGGCPGWSQGSYYPRCPVCQQTMTFLGQYDLRTVTQKDLWAFAYLMAFICARCGKSTTSYIAQ